MTVGVSAAVWIREVLKSLYSMPKRRSVGDGNPGSEKKPRDTAALDPAQWEYVKKMTAWLLDC